MNLSATKCSNGPLVPPHWASHERGAWQLSKDERSGRMSRSEDCLVTIVVSQRERFGDSARSLDSIYEHSDAPFDLVYVDGGSPRYVRDYIATAASARGFKLIRSEVFLSPNQARNLGLYHVRTRYVVFIDNDVVVSPGWLTPLIACA